MTKKEFKRAMLCGLGRCIQTLDTEEDIEKYRDIILWGCTHEIFYDAQCEGTKSRYLYEMVKHYPDVSPFIEAVIDCARQQMTKNSWLFFQCCEFLGFFAADGDKRACQALYALYEELYRILVHKRKRTKYGLLPEKDNFEQLCIAIVNMEPTKEDCIRVYCKIVEDIGTLISNSSLSDSWSFAWFQSRWEGELGEKRLHNILAKWAEKSESVRYYVAAIRKRQKEMDNRDADKRKMPETAKDIYDILAQGGRVGHDIPIMIVRRFSNSAQEQELKELAKYHKREKDVEIRAQLTRLLAQEESAYLLDVDILLADSRSDYKLLQEYAFQALSYVRHKKAREYAFELLGNVKDPVNILEKAPQLEFFESVFVMLIYNYEKEDAVWFTEAVKAIPVLRGMSQMRAQAPALGSLPAGINWHSIYMNLLHIFENKNVDSPPKEILYHMYEHCQCACCREHIVRELSGRRMLTEELLQECLYDSNSDIREFAEKKWKKRWRE